MLYISAIEVSEHFFQFLPWKSEILDKKFLKGFSDEYSIDELLHVKKIPNAEKRDSRMVKALESMGDEVSHNVSCVIFLEFFCKRVISRCHQAVTLYFYYKFKKSIIRISLH